MKLSFQGFALNNKSMKQAFLVKKIETQETERTAHQIFTTIQLLLPFFFVVRSPLSLPIIDKPICWQIEVSS